MIKSRNPTNFYNLNLYSASDIKKRLTYFFSLMMNYDQNTTLVAIGLELIILLLKYKIIFINVIILFFTFHLHSIWLKQLKYKLIKIQKKLLFCVLRCSNTFSCTPYPIESLNLKNAQKPIFFFTSQILAHMNLLLPLQEVSRKTL